MSRLLRRFLPVSLLGLLVAGCAHSTIESRRGEKPDAYERLSAEERQVVDSGQIRVGMDTDAVYIAWGRPNQVVEYQDGGGHTTVWIYHGTTLEETRYWNYRETAANGRRYLERYLDRDYTPREYISAEIDFVEGKVVRWRTLPRPL